MRIKLKTILFTCFLLIGTNQLYSQAKEAQKDSIVDKYIEKLKEENLSDTASFVLHATLGDLLSKNDQSSEAIVHLQKSVAIGAKLNYNDSLVFIDVLNDLAYNLIAINQIRSAEKFIRKHINNTINDWRYVKLCFYYAECLERLGDINLAQQHIERALTISEELNNERYISRSLARLSRMYMLTNSLEDAVQLESKLVQYSYLDRIDQLKVVQFNIATTYMNNKRFNEAIVLFNDIIEWGDINDNAQFVLMGNINKASCLREIGQYENAVRGFKKAIDIDPSQSFAYDNLAEVFYILKNYDSTIYYVKMALEKEQIILPQNVLAEEFKAEILRFPYKEDILVLFYDLAKAYFSKAIESKDREFSELSFDLFMLLDEVINEIRFSTTEQQSQYFWREEVKPIYDKAIALAYYRNDFEHAYYFAEKSKAILLLDALLKNTAKVKGEIPDSLLEIEYVIKQQLFELEIQIASSVKEDQDSLVELMLKKKLELSNLIQTMSKVSPNYINSRYEPPLVNLEQLKTRMAADETIINFVWTEDLLFRFDINKENVNLYKISINDEFKNDLRSLIALLKQPISKKHDYIKINEISSKIYKIIFAQAELKNEKLVILADGIISYLPFEALVINNEFENPIYLLEDKVINYGFSVNTTYAPYKKSKTKDIVAFAPNVYKAELNLANLNYSDFELELILKSGAKLLSNEFASRESILSNFEGKSIIHIYSHAEANDQKHPYPWIAAQDKLIFLPEIYNINSNANLVVLSACETNLGKQVQGEGVISLARGFFHSGSQSVLASLWQVNDKSNSEIVHHFYRYVQKGNTKAEALRLSKLDYIQNHNIESKSPYYWAGMIYIGEDGKLNIKKKRSLNYWIYIVIAIIVLLSFSYRLKKSTYS